MSARTEKKRKAALATKRHARKLEQAGSKVYRGTGTGEWQHIDGIKGWAMDVDWRSACDESDTQLWMRNRFEYERLLAERAIIAASVPAKNYVDRYHRRQAWNAYQLTPEYALRISEFQDMLNAQQLLVSGMLGIPDMSAEFAEVVNRPFLDDALLSTLNAAANHAA